MHLPRLHALRLFGATAGLTLALGCSGLFGQEAPDEDGVADAETGDTGEIEDEEGGPTDSAPLEDTGAEERPDPREGRRRKDRKDRKDRDKRGGGKEKPKPKPKPSGKRICFGGGGLDLRLNVDGSDVSGSLLLDSKINVDVPKLSGTRSGGRVQASGSGSANGKKKTVKIQAGKSGGGAVVKIDGKDVKGARVVSCP